MADFPGSRRVPPVFGSLGGYRRRWLRGIVICYPVAGVDWGGV